MFSEAYRNHFRRNFPFYIQFVPRKIHTHHSITSNNSSYCTIKVHGPPYSIFVILIEGMIITEIID